MIRSRFQGAGRPSAGGLAKRLLPLAALLAAAPAVAPLVAVAGHAWAGLAGPDATDVRAAAVAAFAGGVAAKTLAAAAAAGAAAALLGVLAAPLLAWPPDGRPAARAGRLALLALALAPAALPAVAVGGALSSMTGLGPAPLPGAGREILRWSGLALGWTLAFAPLAALAAAAAWRAVPRSEAKAALALLGAPGLRRHVLLPRLRAPAALIAAGVFVLAAGDVATPPHFGVETVASRLALGFQLSLDTRACALGALPVWLALAALLAVALRPPRAPAGPAPAPLPSGRSASAAALLLAAATVLLLGGACVRALEPAETSWWARHVPEILRTLLEAGAAAVAGAALGLVLLGIRAAAPGGAPAGGAAGAALRGALALPLATSGLVFGLGLAGAAAWLPPSADGAVAWSATLLRAAPWAVLAGVLLPSPPVVRAAAALGIPPLRRATLLYRAGGSGVLPVAAASAAAAALREVDLAGALGRPGGETLGVRAAQLLHYGFRPEVAEVLLLQLLLATALAAAGLSFASRGRPRAGSIA